MPDPRDVLPVLGWCTVAIVGVAFMPWYVPAARRAWGWLCERVARAAYQRGYAAATAREGNLRYIAGYTDGAINTRREIDRQLARARLGAPVTPRASPWGGRLAHLNPPPGFNDSEGDEAL